MTPAEAAARLRASGVEAVVYTSASHGVKGQRWRVLAPLSRSHAPDDHAGLVAILAIEHGTGARRWRLWDAAGGSGFQFGQLLFCLSSD